MTNFLSTDKSYSALRLPVPLMRPYPEQNLLQLYELTLDFKDANRSLLTGPTNMSVPNGVALHPLNPAHFHQSYVANLGGQRNLSALYNFVTWRLQFLDLKAGPTLVGSLANAISPAAYAPLGVFWFELIRSSSSASKTTNAWAIFQCGMIDDGASGVNRWVICARAAKKC